MGARAGMADARRLENRTNLTRPCSSKAMERASHEGTNTADQTADQLQLMATH